MCVCVCVCVCVRQGWGQGQLQTQLGSLEKPGAPRTVAGQGILDQLWLQVGPRACSLTLTGAGGFSFISDILCLLNYMTKMLGGKSGSSVFL